MYSKKTWDPVAKNKKRSTTKLNEDDNGNDDGDIGKLKVESSLKKSDFESSESQSSESCTEQYSYRTVIQTDIEYGKKGGDITKIR
ncbi:hypothetical protein DMENIID0001_071330 [Sergentomyia squamirostris]